ncbi:uncharacterized protein LOC126973600 [Leptidea sinapis]|uniref:uncharacterized protein LOC126973600 n=1 Tax=Leptidea sinapis TaxID=189913 RepID=UPI0021C28898|nr:uncharacterized protein LOC126973600 [Leptidea sinapis]
MQNISENDLLILTLTNGKKLVVTSDKYYGIISLDMYKCVLCKKEFEFNYSNKEFHKKSNKHKKLLATYPHIVEYAENLIRQLDPETNYCTICGVCMSSKVVKRHISTEAHKTGINKASARSFQYKPFENDTE